MRSHLSATQCDVTRQCSPSECAVTSYRHLPKKVRCALWPIHRLPSCHVQTDSMPHSGATLAAPQVVEKATKSTRSKKVADISPAHGRPVPERLKRNDDNNANRGKHKLLRMFACVTGYMIVCHSCVRAHPTSCVLASQRAARRAFMRSMCHSCRLSLNRVFCL